MSRTSQGSVYFEIKADELSQIFNCQMPQELQIGIEHAIDALRDSELVVIPTDTVYGIGCDAFDIAAVSKVFSAKLRNNDMPLPVLIGSKETVAGLTYGVPEAAYKLIDAFWPGPLSILFNQVPSLAWDLGGSGEKVLLRMPMDPVALELLNQIGPMAVTSANISGNPPALTIDQAQASLGGHVSVYLDNGASRLAIPSTIVDITDPAKEIKILRQGAILPTQLAQVLGVEPHSFIT